MLPLLGGLISGGAGLLGSIFSSNTAAENTAANIGMQRETNAMSIAEAQKNRDFQQQMSSTAYQRASSDMTSAGLNPMMMFGSGSAASTPSGATPSLGTAKSEKTSPFAALGDAASKAVSSAVQLKTMDKMSDEMANLEVENARIRAMTKNVGAQTATELARRENVEAQTATERRRPENVEATTKNVQQDTTQRKLDRARQEWEATKYLDLSEISDTVRKAGNKGSWIGGKAADTISPLLSGVGMLKRLMPSKTTKESSGWSSKGGEWQSYDSWLKR